jgi:hypothetical protein
MRGNLGRQKKSKAAMLVALQIVPHVFWSAASIAALVFSF